MSEKSKKSRESNFSTEEVVFLIETVREYIHILENKRTDGSQLKAKKLAWKSICEAFDQNPNCRTRSNEQLLAKWKGLKRETKSKLCEFRKSQKATGGGPPPPELPEIYRLIYEMIPSHFERIDNEFDDDADDITTDARRGSLQYEDQQGDRLSSSEKLMSQDESEMSEPPTKSWRGFHSEQKKKVEISCKKSADEGEKQMLITLRKEQMIAEHQLKMEALREEVKASKAKAEYYSMLMQNMPVCCPPSSSYDPVSKHVTKASYVYDSQMMSEAEGHTDSNAFALLDI